MLIFSDGGGGRGGFLKKKKMEICINLSQIARTDWGLSTISLPLLVVLAEVALKL
jgi:hypothetical protein